MSLTAADIDEIVRAVEFNSSKRSPRGRELRELLATLGDYRFERRRATPLIMLCRAGVDYAWSRLEKKTKSDLLVQLSSKAKASLKRHLQKTLVSITRPTFEMEWTSFTLALDSLGFSRTESATVTIQMFLRERPAHRLGQMFKSFPVLADLWTLAISQWHTHVNEILVRSRKDRVAISRLFADKDLPGKMEDLRLGLSDPHRGGRSVALIQFSQGRHVIYKPRSGANESAWFAFLASMNRLGFRPRLRLLRMLVRKAYCWMEYAEAAPCAQTRAVRRFYERVGGIIAAAYLLKAVDCHRENLIAAGEHPILVDVDALWHVSSGTKTLSATDVLYRTGFFPTARRGSLQSRSSVLGRGSRGGHLPHIGDCPAPPSCYANAIILGFRRAWRCVLATPKRRTAFLARLESIRARERRWIYCSTAKYGAILSASLRPAVLRSTDRRETLIARSCSRPEVSQAVVRAEKRALVELDIPYFNRRTQESMCPEPNRAPVKLIQAMRQALAWPEN